MFMNIKALSVPTRFLSLSLSRDVYILNFDILYNIINESKKEVRKSLFSLPGSLLIKAIMPSRFRFLWFALVAVMATLHRRVHLEHFKWLFYIGHLANAKDNLSTALKHRINCFANEKRDRSLGRLLWLVLCLLFFVGLERENRKVWKRWIIVIKIVKNITCR